MDQKLAYFSGDVSLSPLQKIFHPKGSVYHALKSSDNSFENFGEAYFTSISKNEFKGWKKHTKMVLNLIVPLGDVSFFIYGENSGECIEVVIGNTNYARLTIKPNYWVSFKGLSSELNLILNIASIEHDPKESMNAPLDAYPFPD